jgi:hypothetical protein
MASIRACAVWAEQIPKQRSNANHHLEQYMEGSSKMSTRFFP